MMVRGGHRGAPSVIAAFASFIHDREGTANYQSNDDNDRYYGSVHCNLPGGTLPGVKHARVQLRPAPLLAPLISHHFRQRWVL
jgi:hypothetical protein